MNDTHYIIVFSCFFLLLGLISPLLNEEFNSNLIDEDVESVNPEEESYSSLTIWQVIFNLFTIPFWTFGLPGWVNLWILLPIRLPFVFVIARNIWVGGGG